MREDAEQIGEAYQASILGGMLGVEDEFEAEGFKECLELSNEWSLEAKVEWPQGHEVSSQDEC